MFFHNSIAICVKIRGKKEIFVIKWYVFVLEGRKTRRKVYKSGVPPPAVARLFEIFPHLLATKRRG